VRKPNINTRIIIPLIVIIVISGCKKEESLPPPDVDITGIWAGRWQGDTDTDHGNLLLEAEQVGAELEGEISFREDLPSLANSGVDLEGTVFGNEISFRMTGGSEYSFHGVVDGNGISGEIEYGAVWNVALIPSSELHIIDSFDCPGDIPRYIAVDSQKIWVFDQYDRNIIQISKQTGNEEKTLFNREPSDDSFNSHGIASDGMYIYSSDHRKISKILISNPDDLEDINTPDINISKLCFDGEYFRVIDYISIHIHILSKTGTLISTKESHGLASGIAFDGKNIWILQRTPEILIKYGDEGELLEACKLPKSLDNYYSYHDLAYDGQNFWVLVSHYSEDQPWKYYIYKLGDE
jgi:hypothetical protein